jgi:hypothetical protein
MATTPKSKWNPEGIDYNKDKQVDANDDIFAVKDYDGDGKVSQKEEERFIKERDETNTKYKYNAKGELVESKVTGSGKEVPEPSLSFSQYTEKFLANKPEVRRAIQLAIKYKWSQDQFNNYLEVETAWGRSTTDTQAAFDLQIKGNKSEELTDPTTGKIPVTRKRIADLATSMGVAIADADLEKYAKTVVRSGLDDETVRAWIAGQFSMAPPAGATGPTLPGEPGAPAAPAQTIQGTASEISDAIKRLARSYGVTITPETLQTKIQEGLRQGPNWTSWVEGQRNIFRQSAKTMYATVADKLDEYTLEDLVDPYLEDAANLLGVPRANMDLSNPMWTKALSGADGKPMTREEWMRTLRMDKQYGWNNTQRAKTEMVELGDELLAAFGMA